MGQNETMTGTAIQRDLDMGSRTAARAWRFRLIAIHDLLGRGEKKAHVLIDQPNT